MGWHRRGVVAAFLFSASFGRAQDDAFSEFLQNEAAQFEEFESVERRDFSSFQVADSTAYASFRAEVERRWDRFDEPAAKNWTEYDSDLSSRSTVDFEDGAATVEVIAREGTSDAALRAQLEDKLTRMLTSPGTTDDFAGRGDKAALGAAEAVSKRPVLAGQVDDGRGQSVTPDRVREFASRTAAGEAVERTTYRGGDGAVRVKLMVSVALVPDHLRRRAKQFLPDVRAMRASVAQRKQVAPMPVELVLAIMQTESYFNPKARSHVPAYGLMQLVPRSGARDALDYLGEADRTMGASELYVSRRNIELGVAYLSRLWHQYYGKIEDLECRQYCVIAAYNTGPGNVNQTINAGNRDVPRAKRKRFGPAVARVNREFGGRGSAMKEHLLRNLPYDETKGYLRKVSERMGNYAEWGQTG